MTMAKVFLTLAAIQYGLFPLIADFSPSHVFHEDWPPHARFHLVWLLTLGSSIAAYVLYLVWGPSQNRMRNLLRACPLGLIVLAGFFVASGTTDFYGGAISDPDHGREIIGIDANHFSFSIGLIFQFTATLIVWTRRSIN